MILTMWARLGCLQLAQDSLRRCKEVENSQALLPDIQLQSATMSLGKVRLEHAPEQAYLGV